MSARSKWGAMAIAALMAVSTAALAENPQTRGGSGKPSSVKWNCDRTKQECSCKSSDPQDCADMIKDAPCTGEVRAVKGGFSCFYKPQSKN